MYAILCLFPQDVAFGPDVATLEKRYPLLVFRIQQRTPASRQMDRWREIRKFRQRTQFSQLPQILLECHGLRAVQIVDPRFTGWQSLAQHESPARRPSLARKQTPEIGIHISHERMVILADFGGNAEEPEQWVWSFTSVGLLEDSGVHSQTGVQARPPVVVLHHHAQVRLKLLPERSGNLTAEKRNRKYRGDTGIGGDNIQSAREGHFV